MAAKGADRIAGNTVVTVDSTKAARAHRRDREAAIKYINRKPVADFDGRVCWLTAPALSCTQTLVTASPAMKAASLKAGVEFGSEPSIETQAKTYKSVFVFPSKHIVDSTLWTVSPF